MSFVAVIAGGPEFAWAVLGADCGVSEKKDTESSVDNVEEKTVEDQEMGEPECLS